MRAFPFQGVAVAAVTPFTDGGALDLAPFEDLVGWWLEQGIDGLVACGSTGEFAYLSPDERLRLFERAAAACAGKVPVIAGTGFPDTGTTLQVTRAAQELGVSAAMVVTPYYYPLSDEAMVAHYEAVASETFLPVFVYNMPPLAHVDLAPELIGRLARIEGIAGIKDSGGDLDALRAVIAGTPDDFCVLTGSFPLLVDAVEAGASGAILALANLIPAACARIRRLALTDPAAARKRHQAHDALAAWVKANGIPGIKHKLAELGRPAGRPRLPLRPLAAA